MAAKNPLGRAAVQPVLTTVRPLVAPAIATALALATFFVLIIPGVLVCDVPGFACSARVDEGAYANGALQKEVVSGLEEQLHRLRAKLAQPAICSIDDYRGGASPSLLPGTAAPPSALRPQGAGPALPTGPRQSSPASPAAPAGASAPSGSNQANPPSPATPPATGPRQASAAPARPATPGTPLSPSGLLAAADQATALVIVPAREGNRVSTGTAFFINDRDLVTNHHVVQSGSPDHLFIVNAAVGLLQARVIAASEGSRPGTPDFAVLQLEQSVRIKPLDLAMKVQRLQAVTSAGYPGMILNSDPTYRSLMQGTDPTAIPALIPSAGIVAAVQRQPAAEVIVHSATLYPGNSGGPLLDNCAGVVGVNTFIQSDQQLVRGTQYSLASSTLASFLRDKGIRFNQAPDCTEPQSDPAPSTRR